MSEPLARVAYESTDAERVDVVERALDLPVVRVSAWVRSFVVVPLFAAAGAWLLLSCWPNMVTRRGLVAGGIAGFVVGLLMHRWTRLRLRSRTRASSLRRLRAKYGTGPHAFAVELHADRLAFVAGAERREIPWSRVRRVTVRGDDLEFGTFAMLVVVRGRGFTSPASQAEFFHTAEWLAGKRWRWA